MSDEIKLKLYMALENGEHIEAFGTNANLAFTQNEQGGNGPVLSITTSEVLVDFGDVVTPGFLMLKNLSDEAIDIDYGPSQGGSGVTMIDPPFGRLGPGEPAFLRVHPDTDLMMVASSGTALVKMLLLED